MDSSVHPPKVTHLHHRFEGWLGDDLLETFPCFLVSSALARALEEARLVGFSLDKVEVSVSPEFLELSPGRTLPEFRWLKISGKGPNDDFGLTQDFRLEVSGWALDVLKKFNIAHAVIAESDSTSPPSRS
jgi:hypothetical protein